MSPVNLLGPAPSGMELATVTILTMLLDTLIKRKILSRAEIFEILTEAHNELVLDSTVAPVAEALDIVSKMATRFDSSSQLN